MNVHVKNLISQVTVVVILVCLVFGCSQPTADQRGNSSSGGSDEATKGSYIESLAKQKGKKSFSLNMADDQQYEYIKNCYLEAGDTPESAPELFAGLERARQEAKSGEISRSRAETDEGLTVQDFLISEVITKNGIIYISATSTVKGGSKASYIRLRVKDKDGKILSKGPGGWAMKQDFISEGKCFTHEIEIPMPSTKVTVITIEGLEILNVNGTLEYRSAVVKAIVGENDPGLMERMVIEHPSDQNGDGIIKVGVTRGYLKKDDYDPMKKFYGKIKIPFQGTFRVPYKVTKAQIDTANTFIKLIGPRKGGTVAMKYLGTGGTNFAYALKFSEGIKGSTIIEWNIPQEHSWFDANLFQNLKYNGREKVNWYINISFKNAEIFPGWTEDITYCASNDRGTNNFLEGLYPPHIEFWDSCIAAGSVVRMADGTLKPIEKVMMGELVKANGIDLAVTDISVGIEASPMVRIVDKKALNLLLTQNHPVITKNKGVVMARMVSAGDIIVTEGGESTVTYAGKEMYNGAVYNLILGSQYDVGSVPENANMFYANGILVGDGAMQMKLESSQQEK